MANLRVDLIPVAYMHTITDPNGKPVETVLTFTEECPWPYIKESANLMKQYKVVELFTPPEGYALEAVPAKRRRR